ncbi:MAG: polysaccharide deacetylase family protein [Oscillospiraceae bacterium]|nr:polysaccharide deacetylase family protein [Oscillospiraceae bacterium]
MRKKKDNAFFRHGKHKKKEDKKHKKNRTISMALLTTALLVSAVLCFLVYQNLFKEKEKIQLTNTSIENKKQNSEESKQVAAVPHDIKEEAIIGASPDSRKKYGYDAKKVQQRLEDENFSPIDDKKVVFLTFDDGPSSYTDKVLSVLDEYDVKATFFVTGTNIENMPGRAKKIYEKGHALANHTYSHDYDKLYPYATLNLDNFVEELERTLDIIRKDLENNNFTTKVVRCPGGYMSWSGMEKLKHYAKEKEIALIDWNALNGDSEGRTKTQEQLLECMEESSENKDMIVFLMHDTKAKTVSSLHKIIEFFKNKSYSFRILI